MKKYLILISLVTILTVQAMSQVKIGLNAMPGISVNRISSQSDSIDLTSDGAGFRIALGVLLDIESNKRYHFSTGIYWFPKRVGIRMENRQNVVSQIHKLQYIQVPFNLKLTTDEISIDKWIFFQFGFAFEMKVDESGGELDELFLKEFNFLDIVLDFGIGLEMKLGQNTSLFTGITYYRGVLNAIEPESFLKGDFKAKNDFWTLNMGLKF